jgi:exocyst complex component 4
MSEYSSDQTTGSPRSRPTQDRDSVSTTRSDASLGKSYSKRNGMTSASDTRSKGNASVEQSPLSPSSMAAIMAFQNAGQRKRAQTSGSEDYEYEREKKREREKEVLMQQRIRERAPGRRTNGKARAGDIDGISHSYFSLRYRHFGNCDFLQPSWIRSRTSGTL